MSIRWVVLLLDPRCYNVTSFLKQDKEKLWQVGTQLGKVQPQRLRRASARGGGFILARLINSMLKAD